MFLGCGTSLIASGCATSASSGDEASASGKPEKRSKNKKKVGGSMPSIVVRALEGKRKIDLGALEGKVVLVDIWASWCAPCMEEMPLLDDMAKRLKKAGIEVIAVSVDEERESAEAFLSSRSKWSLTVAHDPEGKVPEVLKPNKMPTSYVVDAKGIIRFVNEGFERDDIQALEKRLTALAEDAS